MVAMCVVLGRDMEIFGFAMRRHLQRRLETVAGALAQIGKGGMAFLQYIGRESFSSVRSYLVVLCNLLKVAAKSWNLDWERTYGSIDLL